MNILKNIDKLNGMLTSKKQKDLLAIIKQEAEDLDEMDCDCSDEGPYLNEIDAGIGTIDYNTENIELSALMEALSERLVTTSPNDIIKLLEIKHNGPIYVS